jgi:excisionase family DNA binding protein
METMRKFKGDILDVPTLAKLMGVCPMTIYRHLKRRDPIPGHKVGGKYLFFKKDVEAWIKGK